MGDAAELARAWDEVPDRAGLVDAAARHGLAGVLLLAAPPADEALARRRAREAAHGRARLAWLRGALDEALAALGAAGVRAAALKGPALAARLYPEPWARSSHDLDLLVDAAGLEPALAALGELGYAVEEGPHERYARRHHHHLHLHREGAPLLELHFRAFTGCGITLAAEPLLDRARPGPWGARVLAPEDELLYLSLHAAGHLYERLGWLYDLALLLRAAEPPDLEVAVCLAYETGGAASLALTLALLREWLLPALPAPQDLALPDPAGARFRLARALAGRVHGWREDGPPATLGRVGFQALLGPGPLAGARFLAHHLGRIARRRAQRALPGVTPEEWSG
ncbi:MAG: nucleotidyltransferase family protein [Planctomycetota bacterium]